MSIITRVMMGIVVSLYIAMPAFADPAPVYDVDAMPQQYDDAPDQNQQDYPPPPPPQSVPPSPASQEDIFAPNPPNQGLNNPSPIINPSMPSAPVVNQNVSQRLARLEQQLKNLQSSSMTSRIDSLQNEVQSLRGQLEQLTHQLQQMQNQQKSMYADLDKRLSQMPQKRTNVMANNDDNAVTPLLPKSGRKSNAKQATKTAGVTPVKSVDEQPNVAEEQQIYQTAYNLIKAKRYNDAVNALQTMLKKYPSGQFAANAHYWLGELYGLINKNEQALNEFTTVVKTYPDSPRVADAQLKVGLIYAAQLKWPDAKMAFKKVINTYPGTASSRLAAEQLKQIKQTGH